jgi:hypothetical protein
MKYNWEELHCRRLSLLSDEEIKFLRRSVKTGSYLLKKVVDELGKRDLLMPDKYNGMSGYPKTKK